MKFFLILFGSVVLANSAAVGDAPTSLYYQANGRNIHFMESGNLAGPLLILLHGSPGDWTTWKAVMNDENLVKKFHILVPDRPGFGESGDGNPVPSVSDQVEMLRPMLARNNCENCKTLLVGYSYAGSIASRWVMDHPEEIGSLLLLAGTVSPELSKPQWFECLAGIFHDIMPPDWGSEGVEARELPHELEMMLPNWSKLTLPIIALHGDDDNEVSPKTADFLKSELINDSTLMIQRVPGLDHMVVKRRPDLVIKDIGLLGDGTTQAGVDAVVLDPH